jgi:maleylpyruvate isomerase
LRTREVWIHAVDLGTGFGFDDFPADLLDALITDVTSLRQRRDDGPAAVILPQDREDGWRVVTDAVGGEPLVVRGSTAQLAAWLTGRCTGPELGRWL